MLKVGLTGGIGSGKTTVSNIFNDLGIEVIDTDVIAHQLIEKNQDVLRELVDTFGDSLLDNTDTIDRKKLARIVFGNKEKKRQLESIMHPRIRREVLHRVQYSNIDDNGGYVIIVIPLLLETDFHTLVDRILVVTADEETRIDRVKQRDNRTLNDIRSIIDNQLKEEIRLSAADDIIENNSDIKNLSSQIERLDKKYTNLAAAIK
ncbi:MAG: dephospho-CoA kinase [Gammaproteobacteria bacterium]|nr:dephospho-CoA kinase [Gammaproteobacteria bacterium]